MVWKHRGLKSTVTLGAWTWRIRGQDHSVRDEIFHLAWTEPFFCGRKVAYSTQEKRGSGFFLFIVDLVLLGEWL
jgi:hypothetical protein